MASRTKWIHGVALLALLCALASSSPASGAEKGLNVDLTWGITDAEQDRTIAAIKDSGAKWVRIEIDWQWLAEPWDTPGWEWEPEQVQRHYDRAVRLADRAGLRVLLMVQRSPRSLSGSSIPESPPQDPQDFADFMTETATRYREEVDAYELWNEPNIARFWPSGPNPAEYVELLKAGATAVRAADPGAKVVFAGTAGNDSGFIEGAYEAEPDLGDYFDVMAVHPYPRNAAPPEEIWLESDGAISGYSFAGYRRVRESMLEHGDEKPIWLTELGWSTTTEQSSLGGVDEPTQADYLERAYRFLEQDPYVQVGFWYNLRNNYLSMDANTWEAQLGLLRSDFTPKPAYQAFANVGAPAGQSEGPDESPDSPSDAPATVQEPAMSLRVVIGGHGARRAVRRTDVVVMGEIRDDHGGFVNLRLERRRRDHGRTQWVPGARLRAAVDVEGRYAAHDQIPRGARWRVSAAYRHGPNGKLVRRAKFGT